MSARGWKVGAVERGGSALLTVLGWSLRFDVEGREMLEDLRAQGRPALFAFWHQQILPLAHVHRNEGIVVLVSEHRDGEYIARVIERRGFGTVRGSSTRGGARGLRQLVRAAREGRDLGITPDGPRGPLHEVKPGVITTAQLSGAAILPLAAGCGRAWRLRSWDRFMIPKPFTRVRVRYGTPIDVPRDADAEEQERIRLELETVLIGLGTEVGADP